jgi:hypothetical protein
VLTLIALAVAAMSPASPFSQATLLQDHYSTESANSSPRGSAATYLAPSIVSPECRRDAGRVAACGVITRFFRALNSRRFEAACALLGARLRDENRGLGCPLFLSVYPEPMPWGILGARRSSAGAVVLVALGQSELDRIRMRHHRALVDYERGRLRILETRFVR